MLGATIVGFLIAHFAYKHFNKKEEKKEEHHHHYSPMPAEVPTKPKVLDDDHEDLRSEKHYHPPPNKIQKKRGFYIDEDGNAKLERPSISEVWTIKRDMMGNIVDAFKTDEWTQ